MARSGCGEAGVLLVVLTGLGLGLAGRGEAAPAVSGTVPRTAAPVPEDTSEPGSEGRPARDPAFGGPNAAPVVTLRPSPSLPPPPTTSGEAQGPEPDAPPLVNLYRPPLVRPFEMPGATVAASPAERPATTPVTLDAYHRDYEGPVAGAEAAYQQGVTGRFAEEQDRMGSLDGSWRLVEIGGAPLYALVLTDPTPEGGVEGAWRELTDRPAGQATGLLLSVGRDGEAVVIRFVAPGAASPTVIRMARQGAAWRGTLTDPAGVEHAVVMRTETRF